MNICSRDIASREIDFNGRTAGVPDGQPENMMPPPPVFGWGEIKVVSFLKEKIGWHYQLLPRVTPPNRVTPVSHYSRHSNGHPAVLKKRQKFTHRDAFSPAFLFFTSFVSVCHYSRDAWKHWCLHRAVAHCDCYFCAPCINALSYLLTSFFSSFFPLSRSISLCHENGPLKSS